MPGLASRTILRGRISVEIFVGICYPGKCSTIEVSRDAHSQVKSRRPRQVPKFASTKGKCNSESSRMESLCDGLRLLRCTLCVEPSMWRRSSRTCIRGCTTEYGSASSNSIEKRSRWDSVCIERENGIGILRGNRSKTQGTSMAPTRRTRWISSTELAPSVVAHLEIREILEMDPVARGPVYGTHFPIRFTQLQMVRPTVLPVDAPGETSQAELREHNPFVLCSTSPSSGTLPTQRQALYSAEGDSPRVAVSQLLDQRRAKQVVVGGRSVPRLIQWRRQPKNNQWRPLVQLRLV